MQQCTKCGQEVENESCPNHGEAVNGGSSAKRNAVFRILPIALFGLFTLLIFAFLAAPVTRFGSIIVSGYDLLGQPTTGPYFNCMVALVAFAAMGVFTACIIGFVVIRDKCASIDYTYVLLVYYVAFMIITCVLCGINYPYVEACEILLLVFSALFLAGSIAILFTEKYIAGAHIMRNLLRLFPAMLLMLFSFLICMLLAASIVEISGGGLPGYGAFFVSKIPGFKDYYNCVNTLVVFAAFGLFLSGIIAFCSAEEKNFFKGRLVSNIVASLIYLTVLIIAIILICKPYTITDAEGVKVAVNSAGSGAIAFLVLSIVFPALGFVGLICERALAKRKQ